MTLQEILSRLSNVKKFDGYFMARCPSHSDETNSLRIKEGNKRVFLDCLTICDEATVCASLGIESKDLFFDEQPFQPKDKPILKNNPSTETKAEKRNVVRREPVCIYDYADEQGEILYHKHRVKLYTDDGTTDKEFYFTQPDGAKGLNGVRRVPYRLPELIKAVKENVDIFLCEGEKDADNVRSIGLAATSFKNWKSEFNRHLWTAHVCLIKDHDKAGIKQTDDACGLLFGKTASLKTLDLFQDEPLPEKHGKDFTVWLEIEKQKGLSNEEIAENLCIFADNADTLQPNKQEFAEIMNESESEDFEETDGGSEIQKIGYTFGELEDIDLPMPEEIIKGIRRGKNGLLNAVTDVGKTTLIRNLAVCLIIGKDFPPLTIGNRKLCRVAIIDSEDTLADLRGDIQKMIVRFSPEEKKLVRENLLLISDETFGDEGMRMNQREHFALLVATINDFRADMIFIDTISSSFAIRNENDNAEVKEFVMKPLKRLARRTNAGLLAAHHIGKAKLEEGATRENAHKGRGASAFADQSKAVFNLETDAKSDVILSCGKLKGENFADARLQYDKENRWFSMQGENKSVSKYEMLMELFADGNNFKRNDIDEMLKGEMSIATITRSLTTALERGDLSRKKGVYSKNAQMLTPYSNEHLSINAENQQNQVITAVTESGKIIAPGSCEHLSINGNDNAAGETKKLQNCSNCDLEMNLIENGNLWFCPLGCESRKVK